MEEIKTDTAAKPQSCGFATWSLVLGITGLILCVIVIPSLLAIIFGIIALVKINAAKGLLTGKGKAIAGIVLGGLAFVLMPIVLIAAIAIPNLMTGRQAARETYHTGVLKELESQKLGIDKSAGEMDNLFSSEALAPDLLGSRISANEISAVASLRAIVAAEALWRQQDADGNGIRDYWTYDVSGLYRMLRADGRTKCEFISVDLANADASPADVSIFENSKLAQRLSAKVQPKYGYLFEAMSEDEAGESYNQEMVAGIPAANQTRFAFVAYPETYGKTGTKTFIVDESGTIYEVDPGSNQSKTVLQWPGPNPISIIGPGGAQWKVAD
ncbi:MAG: DUF2950 family protein [Planctomycetes bacterium]|nr:DUF2950 family protein [Planctomycetota bacterium]